MTVIKKKDTTSHQKVALNTTKFKKLTSCMAQLKPKATIRKLDNDSDEDPFLPLLKEKKQEDLQHGRAPGDTNLKGTLREDLSAADTILYEG